MIKKQSINTTFIEEDLTPNSNKRRNGTQYFTKNMVDSTKKIYRSPSSD